MIWQCPAHTTIIRHAVARFLESHKSSPRLNGTKRTLDQYVTVALVIAYSGRNE